MSSRILRGRRKADSVRPNPFISISKAVASNASGAGRQAAVIAAASGLVLTGSIAAHAAEAPVQRDSSPATVAETASEAPTQIVTALATATVNFERPAVASVAAPVIEKPAPVAPAPVAKKAAVTTAAATAPVAKAAAAAPAAAPAAPAAAAPAVGGVNAAMVASAYAQIGIMQDCTAMVERALGSAGIPVGDLGPMQFMNYGKVVSDPQPGDMIVQSGHVAIYIGNGQAISGGINGNQTGIHPISWLTATGPLTYVRAGA
ncbi:cell wall-associated NlpC family hydrolase [Paenarthrobacter nitroguajacolicus]|uniref:NlpC/P60 family protein n=1 Tax=Paenarthrobacter nitroguajacolicus TaxID=211146 RepID=UPI00285C0EFC|nr:NlpC/P60 family protein [Paenarthrobacter nitroguajacolicus]MDR6986746.1 cell wall-associated NlpC family hydrolase [Paenarthrobacter nitroguajacolicus]